MISSHLFWLALGWLGYFFLHSLLASLAVKRWVACRWPKLVPAYRILYNLIAVAALLPLLYPACFMNPVLSPRMVFLARREWPGHADGPF